MTEGIVVLFPKIIHFSAYWALPVCHEADGCHFAGLWLYKLMIQFFLQASDTALARAEPWKMIKGLK